MPVHTWRLRLLFLMLCCNRKLFSREKRLYWSSSCERRSWKRMVAKESSLAACSLGDRNLQLIPDTTYNTQKKCCFPSRQCPKIMRFLGLFFLLAFISNLHSVITMLLHSLISIISNLHSISILHNWRKIIESIRDCTEKLFMVFIPRQKKTNRGLDFLHQILSERLEFLPLANNVFKTGKYLRTHGFGFMATGEIRSL